jgi:Kef-type K+ transport system membrane component KefB
MNNNKIKVILYLIIKIFLFLCVTMLMYFLTNFYIGTAESKKEVIENEFWEYLFGKILCIFIIATFFWVIYFLIERYVFKIKFKIAKKIRTIEIILYFVFSIIFTLSHIYWWCIELGII